MSSGILVIAEAQGASLKKSAAEVAGVGRVLADALSEPLCGLVIGEDPSAAASALAALGIPKVFAAADPRLARYSSDGFAFAAERAVAEMSPRLILLAATATGKDLGPALAARIGATVVSDVVTLSAEGGTIRATRPVYAGKVRIDVEPETPAVVTIRPNVFAAAEENGGGEVEALAIDLTEETIRAVVTEVLASAGRTVDLTEADIVVSGGRGMTGPEHFYLVEELAEALGGVVGASRAVVDAGWRPHAEQVGQTGKTVAPRLYVACGISGAIQHLAGMSSSKCIVAINKDPEAAIFKVADYGIVGDVLDVLPALTAAVKEKRNS